MKKQLVILLEYEEDENCEASVRECLYAGNVQLMVEAFIEECSDHISPDIDATSLADDDTDTFDKIVTMIEESVWCAVTRTT